MENQDEQPETQEVFELEIVVPEFEYDWAFESSQL